MGIATPPILQILQSQGKLKFSNSMSQDYNQGIFSFSNGFERSALTQNQEQQQISQQIRRDKLRVQGGGGGGGGGYEQPSPPLVGIEEEESNGLPVYDPAGMLSEMFNFPPGGGVASSAELLDQQMQLQSSYRTPRPTATEWYGNRQGMFVGGLSSLGDSKNHNDRDRLAQHHHQISGINADSAAVMQLFLMNPQPRSPSPAPPTPHSTSSSTLHMLLPSQSASTSLQGFNMSSSGPFTAGFGTNNNNTSVISQPQLSWLHEGDNNPNEIGGGGVVEGQGLSLSLSSSLQHFEAAKAEELRMADGGLLYYNTQGGASSASSTTHQFNQLKHFGSHHQHLQTGPGQNQQVRVGYGSSLGVVNVLRNSKYAKAAQELLEEFCSVGRDQFKKSKFGRNNTNPSSNPSGSNDGGVGCGGSSSSTKDLPPPSAADRIEHQRRKAKLLSMLDEACNLSLSLSPPSLSFYQQSLTPNFLIYY